MKKLTTILFLLILTLFSCTNRDEEIIDSFNSIKVGLVAYYPFNGNANDVSGNFSHGTVNGSVKLSSDRNGKPNSSYFFPKGYGNLISIPHNDLFNFNSEFTISLWFKFNEPWDYHVESLIYKSYVNSNRGWHIGVNQDNSISDKKFGVYFESPTAKVVPMFEFLSKENLVNKWINVTYVFKDNCMKCYLNGICSYAKQTYFKDFNNKENITIGSSINPVTGTYLKEIDDIGFWNRALTATEVNYLYSNGFEP